jgi:hypothetical protein
LCRLEQGRREKITQRRRERRGAENAEERGGGCGLSIFEGLIPVVKTAGKDAFEAQGTPALQRLTA